MSDEMTPTVAMRITAEAARRALGDYGAHLAVNPPLTPAEDRYVTRLVEREQAEILEWIDHLIQAELEAGKLLLPRDNWGVQAVRRKFGDVLEEVR